jgi:hypothetical protein
VKPDVMLYTEPSGLLLRESMDVNYNYDEQWLFGALFGHDDPGSQEVRSAPELAEWLRQRDTWLPAGAITAHHIDSHDTFWWPLPGEKWFREQAGIAATRALTAVFALSGGPFMMFVGGEEGIEDDLVTIARLRDEHPELVVGKTEAGAVEVGSDRVYAVVRQGSAGRCLVLVNLGDQVVQTTVTLSDPAECAALRDLWSGDSVELTSGDGAGPSLTLEPFQIRVLDLTSGDVA